MNQMNELNEQLEHWKRRSEELLVANIRLKEENLILKKELKVTTDKLYSARMQNDLYKHRLES